MAEIRVREASPQLVKAFENICLDLREATISGAITKMIPRYWDMKKRIEEQNKEIGELSRKLRTLEFKETSLNEHFNDHIRTLAQSLKDAIRSQKQFGTNKISRRRAGQEKSKKLSQPKKRK